jgi:hypothetical protein
VCRRCGTPATARKLAGHVTGRALSIAIVAVAVLAAALVLAILADAVFDNGPQPNYAAGTTANCLRADGYRIYSFRYGRSHALEIRGHHQLTRAFFFRSAAAAKADAGIDSIPAPEKLNVDLDQEGGDFPSFLTACLRSR